MKRKSKKILLITTIITITILLLTIGGYFIILNKFDTKIDKSLLKIGGSSITRIYYFDGDSKEISNAKELKNEEIFLQKSEWCSLYSMPENLYNAFISVEDKRFYEHKGVDWLRTCKAFLNYIFHFDKRGYGGSTITQQLIKNLTGDNEITSKRKIEEIARAINLEKDLSKNEILEMYLNIVYLSQNCYGVGTASQVYFGKNVEDLTLSECASLASIVQNPAKYNPYTNKRNNEKRKNIVLKLMLEQGKISENDYNDAVNEELTINNKIINESNSGIYSWFTEALIEDVSQDLSKKYNISSELARKLILKGGFNIYSTVNPNLQQYVERIYESFNAYVPLENGRSPQSACVVIDPYTSNVLTIVGGAGRKKENLLFNRATMAKRPPGSVIKPLSVYAPGIEESIFNYSTVYDDTPLEIKKDTFWPRNSPDRYRGLVPINYAVEHSINTVAVKALRDLGYNKALKYLDKLRIAYDEKRDKNDASIALGQLTNGESLLNITNAYTSFANNGEISEPKTYYYVTDNLGNVILEKENNKKEVFSEATSYIVTKMLQGVVENGTGKAVKLKNEISVAGKTGTSSNNEDKWFIGYTPYYVCGVWTGYDTPTPMNYTVNPSCVIFDKVMEYAHRKVNMEVEFERPYNVVEQEYCFDSGILPSKLCENDVRGNRRKTGYYLWENRPNSECEIHKNIEISIKDGLMASDDTPQFEKRTVTLIDYNRQNYTDVEILDSEFLIDNKKRKDSN